MKTLLDYNLTYEEAEKLIRNGADVNEKNTLGRTPIFYVKNIEVAKLLIKHGANVNAKNNHGETPIFHVNDLSIAKLLIENNINLNITNDFNSTPLFYVNNLEIIACLIKHGVDVNAKNNFLYTVLDSQVEKYHLTDQERINNAKMLITLGAIAGEVTTYQSFRELFTHKQQKAFDTFITITTNDNDFYHMCLAYQNDQKNNDKIEIKDMEII